MSTDKLIFIGLIILLSLILGGVIGYTIHSPTDKIEVRIDTLRVPSQSSIGTSVKYRNIHDTTWVEVHDTTVVTNPGCLPYQTFREDSLVKVQYTSTSTGNAGTFRYVVSKWNIV